MKILLVAHSYAPAQNGISRVATQLAEGLAKRGHCVEVATQHDSNRHFDELNGVRIRSFKITGNLVSGIKGDLKAYQTFIENDDWDIQHQHGCQIWGFDALLDWFPRRSCKVVVTPHGFSAFSLPNWQSYFARFAKVAVHIDHFTCLSEVTEELPFLKKIGVQHHSIVPNGVDLQEFNQRQHFDLRQKWKIGNRFWALNVSNHVATKGHRTLQQLARKCPEIALTNLGKPVLAERLNLGKFGVSLPCYYECLVQERLISNYSTHQVERNTLVAAYQQADVFVMPSQREAAPLVLLEAMAARLPWVTFEAGNVAELRGGIIVRNENEMQEAVESLRNDPILRNKLGKEGLQQVEKQHDWNCIIEQYIEVYEKLMQP